MREMTANERVKLEADSWRVRLEDMREQLTRERDRARADRDRFAGWLRWIETHEATSLPLAQLISNALDGDPAPTPRTEADR